MEANLDVPSAAMSLNATEAYVIVFDGGAIGNPGKGYGSFLISGPGGFKLRERMEYGDNVTNNVAEYRTLIAALERLSGVLGDQSRAATVRIHGDSALVINQVNRDWKVKKPDLLLLRDEAIHLLSRFGASHLAWHDRRESVRELGH